MPRSDPSSDTSCKDDRYVLEKYENNIFGSFIYFLSPVWDGEIWIKNKEIAEY
jgi:hypothetical protein